MSHKAICRIAVDLLMTAALLFLMTYNMLGDAFHEWVGAGMLILFILHHMLDIQWIKALAKGRYSSFRIVQTISAALVLITMLGSMISGIILSQHIFTFLNIEGGRSVARTVHLLSGYWNLVLLSLHLGIHWQKILKIAGKYFPRKSRIRSWGVRIFGILTAVCGIFAFARQEISSYLFLQTQFVFIDYGKPLLLLLADYAAIMGLFVLVGHYGTQLLKMNRRKKETAHEG